MNQQRVRLGFMGFGEVALSFAQDLSRAGWTDIPVYSPSGARAQPGDAISERAAGVGVRLLRTPRELCENADIILGLTPGRAALKALRALLPHLRERHLYADASSAAVKTVEAQGRLMAGKAAFVDAALMGPVPLNGIKVTMVASGAHARRFHDLLTPHGFDIRVIDGKPGAASAMKLIRGVYIKGMTAVLMETLEAAERYGILEETAADIAESLDKRPFMQSIKRYVCSTAVHAGRRVDEMTDAIALLNALGSSTRLTRATRVSLREIVKLGLREKFGAREPDAIAPVIQAIATAGT